MSVLNRQLPRYLLSKNQLIWTVVFTALFSLVFILLSVPFSDNAWFQLGPGQAFFITVTFLFLASAIVIVSKMLMHRSRKAVSFTILRYVLWDLTEVVLISVLYTFFTLKGSAMGVIDIRQDGIGAIFFGSFVYVLGSLGVPYVFSAMFFEIADKNNTIRMMNYSNVVSDVPVNPYEDKRFTLFDNNGVLKFSIKSDNLYFIESDDNYIKVWYMDSSGEVRQYMLRCRLKTVEDSFVDSDLVRCHRKYIVNIKKVSILRAEKEGYKISLGLEGVDTIPISKTYEQNVLSRFNSQ